MKRSVLLFATLAAWAVLASPAFGQGATGDWVYDAVFEGLNCGGVIEGNPGEVVRVNGTFQLTAARKEVNSTTFVYAGTASDPGLNLVMGGDSCRTSCVVANLFGDLDDEQKEIASGLIFFNQFDAVTDPAKGGPGLVYVVVLKPSTDPEEAPYTAMNAGTTSIREFYFEVTIPAEGEETVSFDFRDGLETASVQSNEVLGQDIQVKLDTDPALVVQDTCTFTVRARQQPPPTLLVIGEDGSSDITIEAAVGQQAQAKVYVAINSDRPDDTEGANSWELSLGYSDGLNVVDADTAAEVFATVPDLEGSLGFEDIQFSPAVDPTLIFQPPPVGASDCDLTAGAAQGKGLVAGVLLIPTEGAEPGKTYWLPAVTGGNVRIMEITLQQAVAFSSGDDDPQVESFSFRNCLQGSAQQIKNNVVVGATNIAPDTQGLTVTFVPVAKSNFIRGELDGEIGEKAGLGDAMFIINWQFLAGPAPACVDAADANADMKYNIGDAVHIVNGFFLGGPRIPPFAECGTDDTSTAATCPPGSVPVCP